jgi:hypothetical protein
VSVGVPVPVPVEPVPELQKCLEEPCHVHCVDKIIYFKPGKNPGKTKAQQIQTTAHSLQYNLGVC